MIADELRRQADVFLDLLELQPKIGRDPSERQAPRESVESVPGPMRRQARGKSGASYVTQRTS